MCALLRAWGIGPGLGPIRLCLDRLGRFSLLFFAQVSRDRASQFVSYRTSHALLRLYRSGVGLSFLGCGYASVGYSVQPVRGKARAGVGSDVSSLQQFID